VEHLLGQHEQAERRLRAGLRELPDPNSPEAVILLFELALTSYYAADFTGLQEQAAQTVKLAESLDDEALMATASALMTFAGAWSGALEEARSAADRASELMNGLDDPQLALHLEIPYTLGWGQYFLERFEDAVGHLDRGIAVSRATGQGRLFVPMMLGRAMALVSLGRLDEAGAQLDEAVGAARLLGHAQVLSWALWERCWTATAAGDLETAIAAGEESIALGEDLDRNVLGAIAAWCLAAAKLETGDAEGCVELMLSAAGGEDLPLLPPGHRPFFCEVLVRAELSRGNTEAAERWARLAETASEQLGLEALARAHAKRARAAVQHTAGASADAAESALASADEAAEAGAPLESARSRLLAGRALLAAGDRDKAVAELERAESVLDDCGAERWRDEARRDLRAAGKPMHKRTKRGDAHADGLAALTGRELGIAELVTDRKTNKEIAAELFLSEKTVESHLRNIFAKLGVSSRVDVARAVEREHAEAG
jgi:DNA-binding NarL/FixJ family response regulator